MKEGFSTRHTTLQQRALGENPKLKAEDCFLYDKKPGEVAFPKRRKMNHFYMNVSCQSSRQTSLWPLRTTQFMFLCRSLCEQSVIPRLETHAIFLGRLEKREKITVGDCARWGKHPSLRSCVTPCVPRGPPASTSPLLEKQTNTSHSSRPPSPWGEEQESWLREL